MEHAINHFLSFEFYLKWPFHAIKSLPVGEIQWGFFL